MRARTDDFRIQILTCAMLLLLLGALAALTLGHSFLYLAATVIFAI